MPISRWELQLGLTRFDMGVEIQDTIADSGLVQENSEELLSWQGPPVFTVAGLHGFHMESAKDGAATVFTQSEDLKGPMSFLMNSFLLGRFMRSDYEGFNRDLKKRAEAA